MLNTPSRRISVIQNHETGGVISTTPPPVLLSVCSMSRAEAMKHYRKLRLTSKNMSPIWVHFTLDTFQFDFQLMADCKLNPADLASITSLELVFSDIYNWLPDSEILPKLVDCEKLRYFKAVYLAHGPWNHEGFRNDAYFTFDELVDLIEALRNSKDDSLASNNANGQAFRELEMISVAIL